LKSQGFCERQPDLWGRSKKLLTKKRACNRVCRRVP
jgi:hypothetical protein